MVARALLVALARRSLSFAQGQAQPFAEGSMNSMVIIYRPSEGLYDPSTRAYINPELTPIYDDPDYPGVGGKAGITDTEGPIPMNIGDEQEYFSSVMIYLPFSGTHPRIDDLVLVVFNPDSVLTGRWFRVTHSPDGGRLTSSRRISAVGIEPSKQWQL